MTYYDPGRIKPTFHDTDIDTNTHRHPRDDPRENVGEDVGIGVVECGF